MDNGDFGSTRTESQILKISYLLKGMALLHYDAINLGEKDLQYGKDFLEKKRSELNLPFISANVYHFGTEKLYTKPYVIKKVGDVRVGIFGVTNTSRVAKNMVRAESGFEIKDPFTIAKALVPVLKKECDVVVALAHLGLRGSQKLAETVPGIDIIISGHERTIIREPMKIGESVILQPGAQGKYLGQLEFEYAGDRVVVQKSAAVALKKTIPNDKTLTELIAKYDQDLVNLYPLESPAALESTSKLTARTCMGCHRQQYRQWNATPHKHAWQALVEKQQTNDTECQKCHTTMYGEQNGFTQLVATPYLVNVQCAECHRLAGGSLEEHFRRPRRKPDQEASGINRQNERDFIAVTEQTCSKCHDSENTPDFHFAILLEKVKH